MAKKRVVITGMGVVAPNGIGLNEFTDALMKGRSGVRFMDKMLELKFGCQVGAQPQVTEAHKAKYLTELQRKRLSADGIIYGCLAAAEAWEDAGMAIRSKDADEPDWESGTIFGSGLAGPIPIREYVYKVDEGQTRRLGSTAIQQAMASGVSAYIAGLIGLGNQVTSNAAACSTGTEALLMGYDRICSGRATRMVCGGCDSASPYLWAGFDAIRVLTRRFNDSPTEASRPMSATASGFVPGGGAGALVLEDFESAQARGARIYAEVLGGYANSGGQRNGGTMTAPNQMGIQRCIEGALHHTGIGAEEIDAISGHLTATMLDAVEISLWAKTLGRHGAAFPYINALKSMTGHCLSAAGAIEAVALALQVQKGFLHASLNCEDLHPEIASWVAPDRIPQSYQQSKLNVVASSSFGFGDANSIIVLKKVEE